MLGMLNDAALLAVTQTMTAVADKKAIQFRVIPNIRLTHGQVLNGMFPLGSHMTHLMHGTGGQPTMLEPTMSICKGANGQVDIHLCKSVPQSTRSLYRSLYRSRGGNELRLVRLYRSPGVNLLVKKMNRA